MYYKHLCAGLLMLWGLASGTMACVAGDGEEMSESWVDEGDLSAQSVSDEVSPDEVTATGPTFPNCGILACPTGTQCQFDSSGAATCTAPPWATCSTFDCGAYYYCQMTATGAICVAGSSDI